MAYASSFKNISYYGRRSGTSAYRLFSNIFLLKPGRRSPAMVYGGRCTADNRTDLLKISIGKAGGIMLPCRITAKSSHAAYALFFT